jgi:hypothetical protein
MFLAGTVYQVYARWPSPAASAAVAAAFPDGRLSLGMPVVIKVVDYNPDDPEWSREMCEREEETCKAVNGCPWAPQLLWASHTDSCSWFVFEAITPDPMVRAATLAGQLAICPLSWFGLGLKVVCLLLLVERLCISVILQLWSCCSVLCCTARSPFTGDSSNSNFFKH